jgi:OOP family OmpA-OmpF porin
MKNLIRTIIGAALLATSATSVLAQGMPSWIPFHSVYIRGDIGGAFGTDTTFRNVPPALPGGAGNAQKSEVHNSLMYGGGIGVRINPMFRTDITVDAIKRLDIEGTNATPGLTSSAHVSSIVGMLNGYFDINGLWPNIFGPLQPYIDAGVGIARNDLSRTSFAAGGATIGSVNSHAFTSFAWGVGTGVAYAVRPNLLVDFSYKYLDLGDMHSGTTLSVGATKVNTPRMSAEYHVHTVMLGLRYEFGAAPPPPPPTPVAAPPAPPPAAVAPQNQVFIVFFEFDKSSLTADGRRVVDQAAAAYKTGRSNVQIAGYTDSAGTARYNLALSKRRADTVKAALVRDGVPAGAIDESWHGEENPRVPTADGVREPQNRRVEIKM